MGLRESLKALSPLNDYSGELLEYLDEAGVTPDSVEEVDDGDLLETYALRYGDEREVFQYTEEAVEELVRGSKAYEMLGEDIRLPEVRDRYVGDGHAWHRVEYIDGEPPQDSDDIRDYGEAVARLHDVELREGYGFVSGLGSEDLETESPDWTHHLGQQIVWQANYLTDSEYIDIDAKERIMDAWAEARSIVPDEPSRSPMHGDLSQGNVLMSDGGQVLLDLDSMVVGDPDLEIIDVRTDNLRFGDTQEPFVQGYSRIRDPVPDEELEPVYRLAGVISTLQGIKYLEDNNIKSFDRERVETQKAQVEGALEDLEKAVRK